MESPPLQNSEMTLGLFFILSLGEVLSSQSLVVYLILSVLADIRGGSMVDKRL